MANIETHYTYVTDKTITSSGYTTISGAKIAKTNFTNGDRYLLKITAQCRGFSANGLYGIRPCTDNGVVQALIAVHSSFVFEPAHGSSFYTFEFVYVWTANSTQDIILQAKASTGTHYIEAITMLAMNLDDSNAGWTKGVEWDWAETDADTDLTTSWSSTNNASVTLPGATQSGDYLVLSSGQIDSNSTSSSCESGAAATNGGTPTADRTILQEGEDTSELMYHTVAELLENVSSNTDRYQESRNDSASKGKRTVSRIFYLYLDALNKHGAIQKTTSTDLGVASFTEHLSLSYTEGSPADYWIVFGWALSFGDVNDFLYFRLQVDGTSVPENRDADYGPVLWDADDRLPSSHCIRTNESLDTSIDIDGKTTNVGTGHDLDEGVIVVFSTELPTTGIIVTPPAALAGSIAAVAATVLGSLTLSPGAALAGGLALDPAVELGSISLTPSAALAGGHAVAPTVVFGSLTASPAAALAGAFAVDPTVVYGSTSASPDPALAGAVALDPDVVLGSLSLAPAAALAGAKAIDPTVLEDLSITPAAALAGAMAIDPLVFAGDQEVTPPAALAGSIAVDPTVVLGSMAVAPAAALAGASAIDPTVLLGSISLTPGAAIADASAVAPVVELGSIVLVPVAAIAGADAVAPTIIYGSVTATPAAALAGATAIAPVVVLGSVTLTPSAALAGAGAINPAIVLGALSITPDSALAGAKAIDPTVLEGGDIALTPPAALAGALAVDPGVVHGSLTIAPPSALAGALAIAPTVVISGEPVAGFGYTVYTIHDRVRVEE